MAGCARAVADVRPVASTRKSARRCCRPPPLMNSMRQVGARVRVTRDGPRTAHDAGACLLRGAGQALIEAAAVDVPSVAVGIEDEMGLVQLRVPPGRGHGWGGRMSLREECIPHPQSNQGQSRARREDFPAAVRLVVGSFEHDDPGPGTRQSDCGCGSAWTAADDGHVAHGIHRWRPLLLQCAIRR